MLKKHGINIRMSRRGNVYDNAMADSFVKTLKYEEVYRTEYLPPNLAAKRSGSTVAQRKRQCRKR